MAWLLDYLKDKDNIADLASVSAVDTTDLTSFEDSTFPAVNAVKLPVSKPCRLYNKLGSNGTVNFQLSFNEAKSIDFVAIVGHNISSGATVKLQGASSFGGTTLNQTLTWRKNLLFHKFSSTQTYQYFQFTFSDLANVQGFIQIGYILIGSLSSLSYGFVDYTFNEEHLSTQYMSETDVRNSGNLSTYQSLDLNFNHKSQAEVDTLKAVFTSIRGDDELIMFLPDDTRNDLIFGRIDSEFKTSYVPAVISPLVNFSVKIRSENFGKSTVEKLPVIIAGEELGSEWTFARQGTNTYYKDADLKLIQAAANEFRNEHYYDYGKFGFLLEGQNTNLVEDSNDFSAATAGWAGQGDFTETELSSGGIFSTGESAWQFDNLGGVGSRSIRASSGLPALANGTWYCFSVILENIDAANWSIGIRNTTDATWVIQTYYTWSTGLTSGTTGSAYTAGAYNVYTEPYGPNRIRLTVAGAAQAADDGDTVNLYIYPTGTSINTDSAILHHAQYETPMWMPSSPIVTSGASAIRYADQLYKSWDMEGEPLTVYMRLVELGGKNHPTGSDLYYLAVGQTGNNSNPRIVLYNYGTVTTLGRGPYRMYNGPGASTSAQHVSEAQMGNVSVGNVVEILGVINPASDCDMEMTVNGTTYVGTATTDAYPGFNSAALERIAINGDTTLAAGKEKPNLFQCIKILRGDQSLATMRGLK